MNCVDLTQWNDILKLWTNHEHIKGGLILVQQIIIIFCDENDVENDNVFRTFYTNPSKFQPVKMMNMTVKKWGKLNKEEAELLGVKTPAMEIRAIDCSTVLVVYVDTKELEGVEVEFADVIALYGDDGSA